VNESTTMRPTEPSASETPKPAHETAPSTPTAEGSGLPVTADDVPMLPHAAILSVTSSARRFSNTSRSNHPLERNAAVHFRVLDPVLNRGRNEGPTVPTPCASDHKSEASGGAASSIDESLDDGASTAGGKSRVSSTGGSSTRFTICGLHIKVPFTVWTFLAMSVPVIMLFITATIPMVAAGEELSAIDQFQVLSHDVSDCVTAVAAEDHALHYFVYHSRDDGSALPKYRTAQAEVDRVCDDVLLSDLRVIAVKDAEFDAKRDAMQTAIRRLVSARTLMDHYITAGNTTAEKLLLDTMRPALDAVVFRATNTIARAAEVIESKTGRLFVDLKLVGDARAKLWLAASTGSALLSTPHPTTAELVAFVAAEGAAELAVESVEGAATAASAKLVATWHQKPATLTMFAELQGVLHEQSAAAAASHNASRFASLMQGPLEDLRDVETEIVHAIDESRATKALVAKNAALLAAGVLLSAVAAVLLARQQLKVQSVLQQNIHRVELTKRAVAAFVPRFFLNKMGYTSITHVCVGDAAEVALTMLFADIRQFTTVAEGMTSRALFDWVQGYFKLMTTIIEGHHGNINQFIGDALFALFSTATNGVACAIEMQTKTQQLNLQRLCVEGTSVPLNIGIGLHHDVLSLGILGDEHRHTCTAISASVNLASRLEGLTKQLGCRILASDAVVEQMVPSAREQVKMRRVGPAQVKGSGADIVIHDIFQSDERDLQALKEATLQPFTEYAELCFRSSGAAPSEGVANPSRGLLAGPSVTSERRLAELRKQLDAAAADGGVVDRVVPALQRFARPMEGHLVFDEK